MSKLFTIGFTKKDAKKFFSLLKDNDVSILVDVRLNNVSQLAGFAKYPDIEYFVNEICGALYVSDKFFSPEESTLKDYKSGKIDWNGYLEQFSKTLKDRNVTQYIKEKYEEQIKGNNICFLCSEHTPEFCHRRIIAELFASIFDIEVIHLY